MTPGKQPLVLLAEDDELMRELVCARLTREGMRVVEVEDGFELRDYLDLCRPGGDVASPDVVVSDINMPGETGPEALERSHFLNAPVVLISACGSKELRRWAARLGVAAIFEKPFDLDLLVLAIRHLVLPELKPLRLSS